MVLICCSNLSKRWFGEAGYLNSSIKMDDIFFRLYYRYSSLLVLIISLTIMAREWMTESLDCAPYSTIEQNQIAADRFNLYCRLHNRFIPIVDYDGSQLQCPNSMNTKVDVDSLLRQYWNPRHPIPKYQWFSLALTTFASLFYIPYLMWMYLNRTMIRNLVDRAKHCAKPMAVASDIRTGANLASLVSERPYFAISYVCLKLCNLSILLVILYFTNLILQQQFFRLPLNLYENMGGNNSMSTGEQPCPTVLQLQSSQLYQSGGQVPSIRSTSQQARSYHSNNFLITEDIFPRVTLCPYVYESSLSDQESSQVALVKCLMPVNSMLEQSFLLLWFWYCLVLLLTAFDFGRYLLLFAIPPLRVHLLRYNTNDSFDPVIYRKLGKSFSSWLFTTVVLLNNDIIDNRPRFNYDPETQPMT